MSQIRCAIYTRKSSEEGLEQSFNSLHAQREACESYINSQRHEGWQTIRAVYDDGGFSGGNLDRPGMQRLMADIKEGKIDTVVVYKVDRLTRSLADFAKIIEQFDAKQVSFVSVTQQFNTTTSMGRLTLNVLLSFAQFEREVTGERIRDKIAASKAKGMWMGGYVPLGYDLHERRLVINTKDAKTIREIFNHYLRLLSVPSLMSYLKESDIRTKIRSGTDGQLTGGGFYSRGALYQLLRNHIYVGEIEHKGAIYPGEHSGIIERDTWDQVQMLLDQNRQGLQRRPRTESGSLLTGILFDQAGIRYIPTHSQKSGRRYHYYTSQSVVKGAKESASISRVPAASIESAIADRVRAFLESSDQMLEFLKEISPSPTGPEKLLNRAKTLASQWQRMPGAERATTLRSILHRVIVMDGEIELRLRVESLHQLLSGKPFQNQTGTEKVQPFSLSLAFRHIGQGKSLKLVIENELPTSSQSREAIQKAIARARSWYDLIVQGKASSLPEIARQEGVSHRYIKNIFPLAFLGPKAVEIILKGRNRQPVTLAMLMRKIPADWEQQRALFAEK